MVRSDAEARAVVEEARRTNRSVPTIGLLGGDLCRTLGGRGDEPRLHSEEALTVPVDLGVVDLGGDRHWFVAHLVARRSWWFGRVVAVMNAEYLGAWDVAPRAHPNDGVLDVLDATMRLAERWHARRRLADGSHVPHPRIRENRTATVSIDFDRSVPVLLDGDRVGEARELRVGVEPDAVTCVV
jgi:YegS C-terminal NAD kinase beta sandwich-like domain